MIKTGQQLDRLMGWMEALADATRLRLLALLERRELGVTELCQVLQMPQSSVSRHLKLLSDQGWVHNRRQGTSNLYRMILDELSPPARKLWLLTREQTQGWSTLEQDRLRLTRLMEERQGDAQSFFAGAAGRWDQLRAQLYGRGLTQSAVLGLLPSEWVVVDLGCGTGQIAAELAPQVIKVIGVDQSEAMLKAARKRTGHLGNVELRRGELEHAPLEDTSCDAALLTLVLTYVHDPSAVLREAARVLHPGGRVVVVDLLRHDREDFRRQMGQERLGFEPGELTRMMNEVGLKDANCRPLPPESGAQGPALLVATGRKP